MNQRLLNQYEEITYEALTRVCETNGARVFPKVRVADVFPLENSGISSAHYSYGLRSHFDFLITDEEYQPQFSVEFDGPLHRTNQVQRQRDTLKNDLCNRFNHGLLRINSKYLSSSYRGLDLLTYFVDAWFLELAFDEAQRNGQIPYDEPFDMTFIYSTGTSGGKKWPYWLSLDIQLDLQRLHAAQKIGQMAPSHHVGIDENGNYRCIAWLVMNSDSVLAVITGMRAQQFPAVCKSELVSMLAMFDLHEKMQSVFAGRSALVERGKFFRDQLPMFQKRFPMISGASVGATI